jgi:hypothetical protein
MNRPAKLRWLRRSAFQISLAILAILAWLQMTVQHEFMPPLLIADSRVVGLGNDLALGYFASWIFNVLVVVIPAWTRRRHLRDWLEQRYLDFKDALTKLYLSLLQQSWNWDLILSLRDPNFFSDYFSENISPDQTRWHAVHNALYDHGLQEIRLRCQLFIGDCDLTMGLIGDLDSDFLDLYARLRDILSFASIAEVNYDDIKSLLSRLFPLHCPWSILDGEIKPDIVLTSIRGL